MEQYSIKNLVVLLVILKKGSKTLKNIIRKKKKLKIFLFSINSLLLKMESLDSGIGEIMANLSTS